MTYIMEAWQLHRFLKQRTDEQGVRFIYTPFAQRWQVYAQAPNYEASPRYVELHGGGDIPLAFWLTPKQCGVLMAHLPRATMLGFNALYNGVVQVRFFGHLDVPLIDFAPDGRAIVWERRDDDDFLHRQI